MLTLFKGNMAVYPEDKNINWLEKYKFLECLGEPAIRTYICNALNVRPSGLTVEGKITVQTIDNTTWTALPTTPLTDRNAICIQNQSAQNLKINYDNSVVGWVGILIPANGQRYYDITDDIIIYAKSETSSIDILIEEIA